MGMSHFSRLRRTATGPRLITTALGLMLVAALPIPATHNTARAEAAHDAVLAAIANTKGTFLVYNFGGGNPAPFRNAAGNEYTLDNGGHRARTSEGLWQASETYKPMAAWVAMGKPTFIINANFFDVRGQKGGTWKSTGCTSPLGAYVDTANGSANYNKQVTGTRVYAGKQALSGGDEVWTALATMVFSQGSAPEVVASAGPKDFGYATAPLEGLMDKGVQFVAVSGLKLLLPGFTEQLNDPGPAARPHRARLQVHHRRTHGLPGWQLHPGQPSRPLPRIGRRQGNRARRWQLLGHRAAARRRRHVGRLRLPQR